MLVYSTIVLIFGIYLIFDATLGCNGAGVLLDYQLASYTSVGWKVPIHEVIQSPGFSDYF